MKTGVFNGVRRVGVLQHKGLVGRVTEKQLVKSVEQWDTEDDGKWKGFFLLKGFHNSAFCAEFSQMSKHVLRFHVLFQVHYFILSEKTNSCFI